MAGVKTKQVVALSAIVRTMAAGKHGDKVHGVPPTPPETIVVKANATFAARLEALPFEKRSEYATLMQMRPRPIRDYKDAPGSSADAEAHPNAGNDDKKPAEKKPAAKKPAAKTQPAAKKPAAKTQPAEKTPVAGAGTTPETTSEDLV